jgi:hypothetical protein
MAALTVAQVEKTWVTLLQEQFPGVNINMIKDDLRAAVNAANTWVDANTASFGTALNTNAPTFAAATTAQQKALLLAYVLRFKYNLG